MDSEIESSAETGSADAAPGTQSAHAWNCLGGCGGQGYRRPFDAEDATEACTGRPYRFTVRAFAYNNWDAQYTTTLLRTDDEEAVVEYRDSEDSEVWVEDREFVAPPRPVDLVKYDCPF